MGVPKFYRWISERYPCLSEVIKEYQIPEFDNLYLDMNGIIHVCSHPNDDDPHFRITEEKIFSDICHYIDFLFKMIKPKKVFFMAVDGVAPRAKMNQQRGRRFRTARDAVILEQRARDSGEELPNEARFDSNCITPGTPFMTRLHETLKNFVSYKISTDKLWENIRVFLSGHETPGEGEHKIMDFIRHEKSQNGYNPNTRHCLYGLDADLIMLGLCSHEPHFSLLREEVKFGGKKSQKRTFSPEETTFHLLHLSLLREYLGFEFAAAKDNIQFEFNLENVIDDFVLMSFLVGNDFIPHLPQLHIHHDALPILYNTYIKVLPSLGGYINEAGHLNLERFEKFFTELAKFDEKKFGEDSNFSCPGSKLENNHCKSNNELCTSDSSDFKKLAKLGFSELSLNKSAEYDAFIDDDLSDEDENFALEFNQHKRDYYMNKLDYDQVTPEVLRDQAEGYVRAIQWNLHYYYNGVVSWSWYYPHHYAPYISDVKDFKNMEMKFDFGEPFLPFQQLLAVLPLLSKELLPQSYQDLMCDDDSPLRDCYPDDFITDLNGKQQDWEAVVLIPFINEKLLLKCATNADKSLAAEDKQRNQHGPHLLYTYTKQSSGSFESFLPGCFPAIESNHAKCVHLALDYFRLPADQIKKGLCDGVQLETLYPGFPTLKHIQHTGHLSNERVKVFQMVSQRDNMMLTITEAVQNDIEMVAESIIGQKIYVGWPHLQEALVVAISDGNMLYSWEISSQSKFSKKQMDAGIWKRQVESINDFYYQRLGIFVGDVCIIVYAKCLTGSRYVYSMDGKVIEEKQWSKTPSNFALQTIVKDIAVHCPKFKADKLLEELFCHGSVVFVLGISYYGCMGEIADHDLLKNNGRMVVKIEIPTEPDFTTVIHNQHKLVSQQYMPGFIMGQRLGIKSYFISRLTGTFFLQTSSKESIKPNRVNIGLNLKFNRKNEEVSGFSKKTKDNQWLYSEQALKTLGEYLSKFPEFFEKLIPFAESDVAYLEDVYPDGDGKDMIHEINSWLKSQQCTSAERQTCGMDNLDSGIVAAIEAVVDATPRSERLSKNIDVTPQLLYCPFFCKGCSIPDPTASFYLFDRVINVQHTSTVPLGLRGTVIGICTAEKECDYVYEVVFDKAFFGGMTIRCSTGRGYRMPPSALINISYGERQLNENRTPKKIYSSEWENMGGNKRDIHKKTTDNWRDKMDNREDKKTDNWRDRMDIRENKRTNNWHGAEKDGLVNRTGHRNAIFSSNAVLPTNIGNCSLNNPASQIQILKKSGQQSIQPVNKPFYKADAAKPSSPNSFFNLQYSFGNVPNTTSQQFVMPKASPSNIGSCRNVPNVNKKNSLPQGQNSEYHDAWNDLIKSSPSKCSQNLPSTQNYGRQVSVEELFQAAHLHNESEKQNSQRAAYTDPYRKQPIADVYDKSTAVLQKPTAADLIQNPTAAGFFQKSSAGLFQTPPAGLRQTPSAGLRQTPSAGLRQTPPAGLRQTPPAGLRQTPSAGLRQTPPTGLRQTPPAGLRQKPTAGLVQKPSSVGALMNLCNTFLGGPPTYLYKKIGMNEWYIASVKLPDGREYSSVQCPVQVEAAESAAECALACLEQSFKSINNPPWQQPHLDQKFMQNTNLMNFRYVAPPQFPTPPLGIQYSSPISYPPQLDTPLLRYPCPPPSAFIPESFVKQNQQLLAGETSIEEIYEQSEDMHTGSDGFSMVGLDNTAAERHKAQNVASHTSDVCQLLDMENRNVFVPLQVLKNTSKKPKEETVPVGLSNTDWPSLPSPNEKLTDIPSDMKQDSKETSPRTYAEKAKCLEQSSKSRNDVPSGLNCSASEFKPKTVRKQRIAAKFSLN